jgi:hypothetical protein
MAQANVHLPEEKDMVLRYLERFSGERGWSITRLDTNAGLLVMRTPATILSWGEEIDVKVRPETKGSFVSVESHPVAQLLDWGRSEEDVRIILSFLKSLPLERNDEAIRGR